MQNNLFLRCRRASNANMARTNDARQQRPENQSLLE